MLRSFFKDSLIYGTANVLAKGIVFFLVPVYTRFFSPKEFGIVDLIATFGGMMSVIVPLGISNGIARYLPDARTPDERISFASSALWFTCIAYVIFSAFAVALTNPMTRVILESTEWKRVYLFSILAISLNGILYFLQNLLRWELKSKKFIISNFISVVATAIAAVVSIAVLKTGVIGVFYGQIIGAVAGGIVAFVHCRSNLRFTFDRGKLRSMLLFGLPMVPALLGEFFTLYVDRLVIKQNLSITDVGLYGVGFRFASVVNLLMTGFSSALVPLIYTHYKDDRTPGEIARIFRIFIAIAVPLIVSITLFSREVIILMTTPQYYSAWTVIPILSTAYLLLTMYNFAPGLNIAMKTRTIAILHLSSAVITTILNILLVPLIGIRGAAVSGLVSAACLFTSYVLLSQRHYPIPHNWRSIGTAAIIGGIISIMAYWFFPADGVSWTWLAGKLLLFFLTTIIIIRTIATPDELRYLREWFLLTRRTR